ncbi:hypothetical protein ACJW30_08G038600 [Castanea mollissima]
MSFVVCWSWGYFAQTKNASFNNKTCKNSMPKPKGMKEAVSGGEKYFQIKKKLLELKLHTVCEETGCPNLSECWSDEIESGMRLKVSESGRGERRLVSSVCVVK